MLEWSRRCPGDGLVWGAALHVDGAVPGPGPLARFLAARLHRAPGLAGHLDGPAGRESWRRAPALDPAAHVVRSDARDPAAAFADMAGARLPDGRPRWQVRLYAGWSARQYLLCYLVHHAR
jgi:hypothetical protein